MCVSDGSPEAENHVHCVKVAARWLRKGCCDYPEKCAECRNNTYDEWYENIDSLRVVSFFIPKDGVDNE